MKKITITILFLSLVFLLFGCGENPFKVPEGTSEVTIFYGNKLEDEKSINKLREYFDRMTVDTITENGHLDNLVFEKEYPILIKIKYVNSTKNIRMNKDGKFYTFGSSKGTISPQYTYYIGRLQENDFEAMLDLFSFDRTKF